MTFLGWAVSYVSKGVSARRESHDIGTRGVAGNQRIQPEAEHAGGFEEEEEDDYFMPNWPGQVATFVTCQGLDQGEYLDLLRRKEKHAPFRPLKAMVKKSREAMNRFPGNFNDGRAAASDCSDSSYGEEYNEILSKTKKVNDALTEFESIINLVDTLRYLPMFRINDKHTKLFNDAGNLIIKLNSLLDEMLDATNVKYKFEPQTYNMEFDTDIAKALAVVEIDNIKQTLNETFCEEMNAVKAVAEIELSDCPKVKGKISWDKLQTYQKMQFASVEARIALVGIEMKAVLERDLEIAGTTIRDEWSVSQEISNIKRKYQLVPAT